MWKDYINEIYENWIISNYSINIFIKDLISNIKDYKLLY